jgi:RimJ/RimL family protein N-acetyltransferase
MSIPATPFLLETERLVLRRFSASDIEPFAAYRSDPEVARYQGWEAPFSLEKAARFVQWAETAVPGKVGDWFQVAIGLRPGGALIGDCGFFVLGEDSRQAEIGFTLAQAFHGQGYAAEAVRRVVDYLFRDLGMHRVRANCDPRNTASGKLLRRLGFRHEGTFIESLWYKGQWTDEDWYAVLEKEWSEKKDE